MELEVTLVTGRSMRQGVGKESGKTSARYRDSVGICEMHPQDLATLGIKPATNVKVSTEFGSIVVKAISSLHFEGPGTIFIPYGPYASMLFNSDTGSSGMPTFKGIHAKVEPAQQESVLDVRQLVKAYYGR